MREQIVRLVKIPDGTSSVMCPERYRIREQQNQRLEFHCEQQPGQLSTRAGEGAGEDAPIADARAGFSK